MVVKLLLSADNLLQPVCIKIIPDRTVGLIFIETVLTLCWYSLDYRKKFWKKFNYNAIQTLYLYLRFFLMYILLGSDI